MSNLQAPPRTEMRELPAPSAAEVAVPAHILAPPDMHRAPDRLDAMPPLHRLPRFEMGSADDGHRSVPPPPPTGEMSSPSIPLGAPPALAHVVPGLPSGALSPSIAPPDPAAAPTVEVARVAEPIQAVEAVEAGSDTPTTDLPAAHAASPAERADEPGTAVAPSPFVIPTLPSNVASKPSQPANDTPPTGRHPNQVDSNEESVWLSSAPPGAMKPVAAKKSSRGRGLVLTLTTAIIAVAVGAGAHIGYDWYESRDDVAGPGVSAEGGGDLAAWSQVDPPALRYTDTVTTVRTDAGVREITAHRDLASGSCIVSIIETDSAGVVTAYELDVRPDRAFLRTSPETPWAPLAVEEARTIIGDEMITTVFTVSDLFPAVALPYVTVLENVERQTPLAALLESPALSAGATDEVSAPTPIARQAIPQPTAVWHYRVIVDTESFRAAEGAAFESWERQLGRLASTRLEVWVDANGIVRQFSFGAEGVTATQTLVGGAPTSTRFDSDPLIDNTALAAAAPAATVAGE